MPDIVVNTKKGKYLLTKGRGAYRNYWVGVRIGNKGELHRAYVHHRIIKKLKHIRKIKNRKYVQTGLTYTEL